MHFFILPTKDLSKHFFLHARVILQNTRGNWTKKNYLEIMLSAYARTSHKLIFCIWIRRLQSVRPVNGFMVSFSSL